MLLLSCNLKKEKKKDVLFQYLNENLFPNNFNNSYKCQFVLSDIPTFSELKEKNVFSNCISCHSDTNPKGNLNLQSYEQTRFRTEPYNPQTSILYLSVLPGGKMEQYSNPCITDAIYKWIKNGSKQ